MLLQNRHTIRPVYKYKGRFKSQALLDEAALAACMAINTNGAGLNPIRAGMAKTPETSDHTSIKQRIKSALNIKHPDAQNIQPENLFPFAANPRENMPDGLPFELSEYIELVGLTGRQMREGGAPLHPATAILVHPCSSNRCNRVADSATP